MVAHYTVYIDEAGDEGIGKLAAGPVGGQSRWLVLGGCIVSRENDLKLPIWRDKILSRFPDKKSRDLHFRELKHEQKMVVCQELAQLPIGVCLTFSHKVTIPGTRWEPIFKKKGFLYNYLLRWLLERATSVCERAAGTEACVLKIVFSRRGGTDYQAMKDYLCLMRDGNEVMNPVRSIRWNVLDIENISVENHKKWAGLQIADCVTSAGFCALEPNRYGNYEQSYAKILRYRYIKSDSSILNCGITPVPSLRRCNLDDAQRAFFESFK